MPKDFQRNFRKTVEKNSEHVFKGIANGKIYGKSMGRSFGSCFGIFFKNFGGSFLASPFDNSLNAFGIFLKICHSIPFGDQKFNTETSEGICKGILIQNYNFLKIVDGN